MAIKNFRRSSNHVGYQDDTLSARVAMAKQAAFNDKVPTCTVLGVSLVDVEMIERGENLNETTGYSSFAHAFVLGIGREGWYLYQL